MGKGSTPARIVIKGHVKGPPEVQQKSGTTVITKELQEGAELEETFPRRRKTGKQKPVPQMVPVDDVMRLVEESTRVLASGSAKHHQAETNRRVQLVSDLASKTIDEERKKTTKAKKRADYAKQRLTAARKQNAVAQRARRDPAGVVESIAAALNTGELPPLPPPQYAVRPGPPRPIPRYSVRP